MSNRFNFSLLVSFSLIFLVSEVSGQAASASVPVFTHLAGSLPSEMEGFLGYLDDICKEDTENQIPAWLFWGQEGTGKTTAAMAVIEKTGFQSKIISARNHHHAKPGKPLNNAQSQEVSYEVRRAAIKATDEGKISGKPTIIFLDDVDLLGFHVAAELRILIDQIMRENNKYVILIFTARQRKDCDIGVAQRSRSVKFILPDLADRYEILKFSAQKIHLAIQDHQLHLISGITQDFSGRDLESIIQRLMQREINLHTLISSYVETSKANPRISSVPGDYVKSLVATTVGVSLLLFLAVRIMRPFCSRVFSVSGQNKK